MPTLLIALKLYSPNTKPHWRKLYNAKKHNDRIIQGAWPTDPINIPCIIHISRLYDTSKHERLWDDDNWVAATKSVRDTVANLLIPGKKSGHADNVKYGLTFRYDQQKVKNCPFVKICKSDILVQISFTEENFDERTIRPDAKVDAGHHF